MIRAAAILCCVNAIGFGGFTIPVMLRVAAGRDIPMVMGFLAYGRGPFEAHGISSTVPLLAGFLIVCVIEGVAGWLLWGGHHSGAIVALARAPLRSRLLVGLRAAHTADLRPGADRADHRGLAGTQGLTARGPGARIHPKAWRQMAW